MNLTHMIAEALKQAGSTDIQVAHADATTVYEKQDRITFVHEGRSYEVSMGLVRHHGSISG